MNKKKSIKEIKVNFLKNVCLEDTYFGKTVKWILTVGKAIVFISFSIIIFIFFYRYTLEKKIDYLSDKINSAITDISQYEQQESSIRILQNKLNAIDKNNTSQIKYFLVLDTIENNLPINSSLKNIEIDNENILISGEAKNEITFSSLLSSLKNEKLFEEIIVNNLNSGGVINPVITFEISMVLSRDL